MTGQLTISISEADRRKLTEAVALYGKQARFAYSLALNDTAKRIVLDTQAAVEANLTIRTPKSRKFLTSRVRVARGGFATRDNPRVVVEVDAGEPIVGRRTSLIATLAGVDGGKESRNGILAVPTSALGRPGATVIPSRLYPKNLRVMERRGVDGGALAPTKSARRTRGKARVKKSQRLGAFQTSSGKWQILGKDRTFAIDPRYHRGNVAAGVYQRTGPGNDDVRLLWHYTPRVPVPQRVPFQRIADEVTRRHFGGYFDRGLERALRTAR